MMDWTDRHYRFMMRLLTKRTLLYTEMLVDQTLLHQQHNLDYFLGHSSVEAPLAIQLGGNSIEQLGEAAKICSTYGGFCEVNLNTGCPSALVSSRCFGARLMLEPERVRDICQSMIRQVAPSTNVPEVTVKCRIGVDDHDSYEELHHFITTVASAGVTHFIVHARKCLLNGLSTHENRTIPPLKYDWVYRLKEDFPELFFTLNGGVQSIQHAKELLDTTYIDGVMIGRAAYNTPWNFRDADRLIFGEASNPNLSRREIIADYLDYAEDMQTKWGVTEPITDVPYCMPTSALMKPLLALFSGAAGGKAFKRAISAQFAQRGPKPEIRELIETALAVVPDEVLDLRVEDELLEEKL
ncbi:hypothetical protein Poli38472_012454 [Pythium oligandrum]|uniref:DUS-like FMN-binding domain-containing protein n=1 Tax=Pythium oligandrum TaxID=41045 RepID=A0A8K1CQW7_PYTOL|nr:hypothetical protein Poli38472_012454 [Pythium oligandrum]|eukprot:TMW67338.1 hypothetical protein Poli38472_012454 [Pythium oligandrum]